MWRSRQKQAAQLGGHGVQMRSDGGVERGMDGGSDERWSDPASTLKMQPRGLLTDGIKHEKERSQWRLKDLGLRR